MQLLSLFSIFLLQLFSTSTFYLLILLKKFAENVLFNLYMPSNFFTINWASFLFKNVFLLTSFNVFISSYFCLNITLPPVFLQKGCSLFCVLCSLFSVLCSSDCHKNFLVFLPSALLKLTLFLLPSVELSAILVLLVPLLNPCPSFFFSPAMHPPYQGYLPVISPFPRLLSPGHIWFVTIKSPL